MSTHISHARKCSGFIRKSIRLVIGLGVIGLVALFILSNKFPQLTPAGPIAQAQLGLIVFSVIVLLTAAVPTVAMLYYMAWKYRESNSSATYEPEQRHSRLMVPMMWFIPSFFMLILALVLFPATHRLEPRKALVSNHATLHVQVIAMRWKWIFIYPEQNIATVNYLEIPTDTPIEFELTADEAPMSSFWIPKLGGQLYAMTGHSNRLNLMADKPGTYTGSSAEINGAGFAEMKFETKATDKSEFDNWVQDTKLEPKSLDSAAYQALLKPSAANPAAYYSTVDPDLFYNLLAKYNSDHNHGSHE